MATPKTTDFEYQEPRFVSIRPHGKLDVDEATAIMDTIAEHISDEPFFTFEVLMSDLDGVTADARRIIAQRLQQLPDRALALVGANFGQRMLAKLVLTAVAMLGGNTKNTAEFFLDSESARAWLTEWEASRTGDR